MHRKHFTIFPLNYYFIIDGGWGWVVTFASFMCNLIIDGIAYTFGILLNPLVEDFDSNRYEENIIYVDYL